VRNYQKNGITADGNGTNVTVSNNYVAGYGPTGSIAQNGIQVSDNAEGKITGNTVVDNFYTGSSNYAASSILIYAAQGIAITGNTVATSQYGVVTVTDRNYGSADHTTISNNTIYNTQTFDGIDVCSSNNTIQQNTIFSSTEAGIHLDGSCGSRGNTVSSNTVNEACAGILVGGTAQQSIGSNIIYNVNYVVLAGDQCPAPQPTSIAAAAMTMVGGAARFSPVR
jgi:parallel beta-helix repeat protein